MSDLGQGIWDKAYEEGMQQGMRQKLEEGIAESREEGRAEGHAEGLFDLAKAFVANGFSAEQVAKISGIPIDKLLVL